MPPQSCDTFVVMGDLTINGHIIFGKNSDRPNGEVQEVIYEKGCSYPAGTKLKVTYLEIDQDSTTYSVILSKPSWMWGAEMGANEHGVCIGNEAIWSNVDANEEEKLLGMDLVRLSLERSKTASEAVTNITTLLNKYGQGGPCSDTDSMFYHNSYLIADKDEAWVLETIDNMWAAEKITKGYRNISNCLSIESNIDLMSDGLKEKAKRLGLWKGVTEFNFKNVFSVENDDINRFKCGQSLLQNLTKASAFSVKNMFEVLRDKHIARGIDSGFPSTGSMVNEISTASRPSCHWFTGTPDPRDSVFKPFIFTPSVSISYFIQSPVFAEEDDPAKVKPRFRKTIDRSHVLYRYHERALQLKTTGILEELRHLENQSVLKVDSFMSKYKDACLSRVDTLFKDCVDAELKCYQLKD